MFNKFLYLFFFFHLIILQHKVEGQLNYTEKQSLAIKIGLLFFTINGTKLTPLWNEWYDQALKEFEIMGYNVDKFPIKGVLFYNQNADVEYIKNNSPKFIENNFIDNPVETRRYMLLKATKQLFENALKLLPDYDFYILVSDSTIPVKPFKQIYADLSIDRRSRADIFCLDHRQGYPKHSEWLVLRNDHAKLLVKDHEAWDTQVKHVNGLCPTLFSATDEYWPLRIIYENGNLTKWEDIQKQFKYNEMDSPIGTLNWHTYVDWTLFNIEGIDKGLGESREETMPGHPRNFLSLTSAFVRYVSSHPNLWFIRKVEEPTLEILNCSMHPLDLLSNTLSAKLHPQKQPYQAIIHAPSKIGDEGNCYLIDFITKLWQYGSFHPITLQSNEEQNYNNKKIYYDLNDTRYFQVYDMSTNELVRGDALEELLGGDLFNPGRISNLGIRRASMFVSAIPAFT